LPLFEVDGDRHHAVTGSGGGAGTTAHRVVESHIDGLLGEQIFPVCSGSGPDEPHLLALDASGAPVVVELASRLDDAALTRALDHAGAAGRMSRGQFSALYRGGPQAFQRDVAEFYDSVPITSSHSGRQGPRLIIICQEADEAVLNAVDFLRQPSMPVEVLRLGVIPTAGGRKLVDVSPLVIHPSSAPDSPQIVVAPSPGRREVATADAQTQAELKEAVVVGLALTGKLPVVVKDAPRSARDVGGPTGLDSVPVPGVPTGSSDVQHAVTGADLSRGAADPVVRRRKPASAAPAAATSAPGAATAAPAAATAAHRAAPADPEFVLAPRQAPPRPAVRRRSRTDRFAPPSNPTPVTGLEEAPARPGTPVGRSAAPVDPTRVAGVPLPPLVVPSLDDFPPPSEPVPMVDLTDPTPHLEDLARIRRETLAGFAINPADDPLAWSLDEEWSTARGEYPVPAPEREAIAFGEVFTQVSSPLDPEWSEAAERGSAPGPPEPEPWWRDEPEASAWDAMTAGADSDGWVTPPTRTADLAESWPAPAPIGSRAPEPWDDPAPGARAWEPPATGPIVLDEDTDADLAALAAQIGVPTALVWERPRRGQRFDAVLHPDGRIQLPDGFHYRHPDVAASAVSGSYTADGWSVWRLGGPSGPTLAEEFHARFA